MELTLEELKSWASEVQAELGLRDFSVYLTSNGDIKLNMISVPKDARKQGIGSEAMDRLTRFADQHGRRIVLTPAMRDPKFGTTSRERLKRFYRRFGFITNSGRNKDFTISDSMLRNPKVNKITFKEFREIVLEAPLPTDWDKAMYRPVNSFAKRIKYAKERAAKVGTGSSRVAFKIEYEGRPTVLKIAKNKKGMAQNEYEANLLNDYYLKGLNIVIPMIDYDEESTQPTWIHTEFATKLKESDIIKVCGGTLYDLLCYAEKVTGRPDMGYYEDHAAAARVRNNEFTDDFTNFIGNYTDMSPADFSNKGNWGMYKGRPVIVDAGLSKDIWKEFYHG